MDHFKRLAVLFDEWARQVADNPDGFEMPLETYGEKCAAFLIQLDEQTDGEKLFPQSGGSV